ncbi:hypothetical protein ADUPG1_012688 [Aduncisulcus paluster]|uniref:Uncharacterized protein n=1 Tax=Aduncisulcus paluster TaxID=2918883 RepID=A0ABQ5K0A9_9EUKA|nr:hypothetical protein ADUPG1_012688 [Aduncisulcus paluster]
MCCHLSIDDSVERSEAWKRKALVGTENVGIISFSDDTPLTAWAYNPMMVCSVTLANFNPSFRQTLASRFILCLTPGGSIEDKSRDIENYITSEIERCNQIFVFHSVLEHSLHLFSPAPSRVVENPFDTLPLPPDLLHMEGRTMLKLVIPLYIAGFNRKEVYTSVLEDINNYKSERNLSLLHYSSWSAHHFYEVCSLLPCLCAHYGLSDNLVNAACYRAEYQYLIFRNYNKWIDDKTTTIRRIVSLMKKHRRCLIEAGMSSTALCVHIFPMHLEKIIEHYGTFQITDTDTDERLNGYIREKASSGSIRSYIPLGITSQNGLHSYKVTVYENVGPRDPGWNPSPGVWCMIKVNQDEQYFVKILKKEELPDRIKSNIISTMISSIDSHPSSKFFFVQYYKAKEIDEVTGDIILTVWEEDEGDSFGVEAQGSLWCEVKVIVNRIIKYHNQNKECF